VLFSERVDNDQHAITSVITRFTRRAGVCWAVDMTTGPAGLLLALLLARHADVRYVSGSLASKMAAAFHGERKTDAKDAVAIAQTARVHPGLPTVTATDTTQAQLRLLTGRSNDLVHERVRTIMRLQDLLTSISPALARALDLTLQGPVYVLAQWQTPAAIRRAGVARIHAMLRPHRVTNASALAQAVVAAARTQTVTVVGEATAAAIIAELATDLLALNQRIHHVEQLITTTLAEHHLAPVVTSLPGIGPVLAAEFLAIAGSLDSYSTSAALAAHAGLAPVSRDSGRIIGSQRRPNRYHRGLSRVFTMSSLSAIRCCPRSRIYYDRKRAEGKTHRQALAALSRRRLDVLWALIRDNQPYQPKPNLAAA
jgi:transposase